MNSTNDFSPSTLTCSSGKDVVTSVGLLVMLDGTAAVSLTGGRGGWVVKMRTSEPAPAEMLPVAVVVVVARVVDTVVVEAVVVNAAVVVDAIRVFSLSCNSCATTLSQSSAYATHKSKLLSST